MSLVEESKRISKMFEEVYRIGLNKKKEELVDDIEKTTMELKDAASKGDLSENSAYTTAVERLSMLNTQLVSVDSIIQFINAHIDDTNYVPIGMVVDYSTVELSVGKKKFIYKLYPGDISDIEKNILAMESPLGKAIYLKSKGDVIAIEHKVTGDPIEYLIVDIY